MTKCVVFLYIVGIIAFTIFRIFKEWHKPTNGTSNGTSGYEDGFFWMAMGDEIGRHHNEMNDYQNTEHYNDGIDF